MLPAKIGKFTAPLIFSALTAVAIPQTVNAAIKSPTAESTGAVVRVSSQQELLAALRQARAPVTIVLSRGAWGGLKLKDLTVPYGTIVRSANVSRPAVFDGIELNNVRGLTLSGVVVKLPASGPVAGRYGVLVLGSRDVLLDKLALEGLGLTGDASNGIAMMLRKNSDITVQKSYFSKFRHGIAMLDLDNSVIQQNEFENLQTDAIRGGGVNYTRIANNVITGFNPARGDHPDGIQLWSTRQRHASREIDIVDNLVVRGNGGPIQGIFVRDTRLRLPFEDLKITGNFIVGGLYNGITVLGAQRLDLRDNQVLSRPDQRSWIRVEYTRNSAAIDNHAFSFVIRNNRTRPLLRNNETVDATDVNVADAVTNWVETKPGFATYRGALLRRLMARGQ